MSNINYMNRKNKRKLYFSIFKNSAMNTLNKCESPSGNVLLLLWGVGIIGFYVWRGL